jgi:hypothetical protein
MGKQKVQVMPVTEAPKLNNPAIQQGIRDSKAAEHWGEKNGHTVVYYMAKRQKVYAERLLTKVDLVAEKIEQASVELVEMAEAALPTGYA